MDEKYAFNPVAFDRAESKPFTHAPPAEVLDLESSGMSLLALVPAAVLLVSLPLLYIYATNYTRKRFPTLRNKRICLLIAHPDDEAMFFAPTVLALTRPQTGNHVKILCLSTGNAVGLGETRKKELKKSAMLLGLRQEDDVFVLDDPDFPDSMTTPWDPAKISILLSLFFAPHLSRPNSPTSPSFAKPTASIDALLTFDSVGVSCHPNHTSLYHGARRFVSTLAKSGYACPVDLYTLTSVNVARKYSGFLDMFATVVGATIGGQANHKSGTGNPGTLMSFSDLFGGRESAGTAREAMTKAHLSQMVWFRWGWITLSRYMVINDLKLEEDTSK